MTRRDWWLGVLAVVVLGLAAAWVIPDRMGRAVVDRATTQVIEQSVNANRKPGPNEQLYLDTMKSLGGGR